MVVVIFVVVAAFALVPCDLFQLTIASPLPPSENSGGGGKLSLSCSHFSGRAFLPQEAEIRHLACPSSSSSFLRLVLAPRSPPGPHSAAPSPSSPAR